MTFQPNPWKMKDMDPFDKDLEIGEIHARDRWQFELKSDFFPSESDSKPIYTQEFYIFIPNALQINEDTYPPSEFYQNQTNFIRYKTPIFSIDELLDPNRSDSPLRRISSIHSSQLSSEKKRTIEIELKLLGNVFRSALRRNVRTLINDKNPTVDGLKFCKDVQSFRNTLLNVKENRLQIWSDPSIRQHFNYVSEFVDNEIHFYLTGLLKKLRLREENVNQKLDEEITSLLTLVTKDTSLEKVNAEDQTKNEFLLYRRSLLNKFVIDALLLDVNRYSFSKKYQNVIGAVAAGIAMLFFFSLFVLQQSILVTNSEVFILGTVILYILKDRIKEGFKVLSYRKALKWFSDYTTEIRTPDEDEVLGRLKESHFFIDSYKVAHEIERIRNLQFHNLLESFKRPETVLYYKKTFEISHGFSPQNHRRIGFNVIFRFNIEDFLKKASKAIHSYVSLNPKTNELETIYLPKVYHLNIILKNTFQDEGQKQKSELKKFRLVVDKDGIKRVEHID